MGAKNIATRKFDFELQGTAKDLGEFQYNVLDSVAGKRYQEGIKLLASYKAMKSTYPQYSRKTDFLFKRGEELINAIEAKKNFPNLTGLSQSKQEEIHQKALENWEDLKIVLRRIRTVEYDLTLADARSSIWVIKALMLSFTVIISVWFVKEVFRSFGHSFPMFIRGLFDFFTEQVAKLF